MFKKKIPYYGKKDSIKSIKRLDNNYFEIEVYGRDGVVSTSKVIVAEEQMLKHYLDAIEGYLFDMKDKYKEACDVVNNNNIKSNCIKMLIVAIIVGIGLPLLGYLMNNALAYYLGFGVTATMCIPTSIYCLKEIIFNTSINEIKQSIKEFEDLVDERNRVKGEINKLAIKKDKTKFSSIDPMRQEVLDNNKKLVKKKE